ncbi:MAG: YkgJ family cysteine cluster protein, partial [Symbiobacteriaceae bacterium]|nr:YkgJ family cysteine cluster protein [Symbiobacteriaceae bacterium]
MLSIIYRDIEGATGLELAAISPTATVASLFPPLQLAGDDPLLPKREHPARLAVCAACRNNCCRRYPIVPDVIAVRHLATKFGYSIENFAKKYLTLPDNFLLAEFQGSSCPFLSQELCTVYDLRPLLCRFYLCV